MRSLTLWNPWAHLVSRGHKLIENRPWEPPAWLLNQDFAIHAGQKWDKVGANVCAENFDGLLPTKLYCDQTEAGSVVAVATLVAVVTTHEDAERMVPGHGKWFSGPYGWVLENVRLISPSIRCRGYQKLWNLPADIEAEVLARLGDR